MLTQQRWAMSIRVGRPIRRALRTGLADTLQPSSRANACSRPARDRPPASVPRRDVRELAAIFAGGVIGALARVGVLQIGLGSAPSWPWATFAVNIFGAFLLGYFTTRLQERLPMSAYRRPLLGTGLCGALTTFSTVQVELLRMLDVHRYALAVSYATASVILGYASVQLATAFARRVRTLA
jgi:CrcB protein